MLAILHVLMQTKTLLFLGFYDFAYVGSCGATLLEDWKCWFLWRQHTFVFFMPYTGIAIEKYKWGQIIDGVGDGGWNGDDYEGRWVMEMGMRKWMKMVSMHKCFQIRWLTNTMVYMWFIMGSLKWQIYINERGIMLTILYDEPLYFYFHLYGLIVCILFRLWKKDGGSGRIDMDMAMWMALYSILFLK